MVYIILVNWNGWRDTIECLESVLRLQYQDFRVIVCDNASTDHSLDRIAQWAGGELAAECSNPKLRQHISPVFPKPVSYFRFSADEKISIVNRPERLFLIQTGANLGFAGANNIGLQLALEDSEMEYAWLLNNDTVVDSGALSLLVERMRQRPEAGMCGPTIFFYSTPETIQYQAGAEFNRWLVRVRPIGRGRSHADALPTDVVERKLQYVTGASMLVGRKFLEQVGPMNEDYFLYFEEIDWATRALGRFTLAYSPNAHVYHKESATIGSRPDARRRSVVADRFFSRGRFLYTRRYHPWCMPTVILVSGYAIVQRILRGLFPNARAIASAFRELVPYSSSSRRIPYIPSTHNELSYSAASAPSGEHRSSNKTA